MIIEGCHSLAAVQDAVRTFSKPYGYDRYVLYSASSMSDEIVERIYWVEGEWFGDGEAVDATTYIRRCPVTRHILAVDAPFSGPKFQINGESGIASFANLKGQVSMVCKSRSSDHTDWLVP